MGLFSKKTVYCRHCGKEAEKRRSRVIGKDDKRFILCPECFSKIGDYFNESMESVWDYNDYLDFLKWDEETKAERESFVVSCKYPEFPEGKGVSGYVEIDDEHRLFRFMRHHAMITPPIVYRFVDMINCEIDEDLIEQKETLLSIKLIGEQFFSFSAARPLSYERIILKSNTTYKCDQVVNESKYNDFIRHFTTVAYIANQEKTGKPVKYSIEEYKKALEFFRYECIQNVTLGQLKEEKDSFLKNIENIRNNYRQDYEEDFLNSYKILYEAVSAKN